MKFFKVVLLGVFATSVYLQGCGEDKVYTSVDEALAAICSSTVCTEYCNTCVTCTMTGNRSATHSHMETCGMNPRGGETCKEVLPCGGSENQTATSAKSLVQKNRLRSHESSSLSLDK
ncbi:unnamed protein product [Cladocopium goreaui]|uniref:Uncharacterized protein n=1 Tax=Cladocopium goreaui TaxID=2562237 RepID=A0A9P1GB88_9DINO|nr:unnamed protein product [Cladocopium goreaui]